MTEQKGRETKELGYGWSKDKLLCYSVQSGVISTLGCLELRQELKLSPRDSKVLESASKATKRAVENVDELYKIICEKERSRTP